MIRLEILDSTRKIKIGRDIGREPFSLIAEGEEVYLGMQETVYCEGDILRVTLDEPNQYVMLKMDTSIESNLVYIPEKVWEYPLYFNSQAVSARAPGCFQGTVHYLSVRLANIEEVNAYQNLALNTHDHKLDTGGFPHASANVETRNDATFFACNAIDGYFANHFHGSFPYQSWGINQQNDAALTIDFGRPVVLDKVKFTLRADFPHDSYWRQVSLNFSDGSKEVFQTEKTAKAQQFSFEPREVTSVIFHELIKAADISPFPALTQIELFGVNKGA